MFKRRVAGRITISQRVYPADIFDSITFVVWSTSIKKGVTGYAPVEYVLD